MLTGQLDVVPRLGAQICEIHVRLASVDDRIGVFARLFRIGSLFQCHLRRKRDRLESINQWKTERENSEKERSKGRRKRKMKKTEEKQSSLLVLKQGS